MAYEHETARRIYRDDNLEASSSPSGIDVSAVAMAEKADKVKDKRKFVS